MMATSDGGILAWSRALYQRMIPSSIRRPLHPLTRRLVAAWDQGRESVEQRVTGCESMPISQWLRDPVARGIHPRLGALEGRYRGKRCVIMGNGPSLNEMDLEVFSDELVWGSNRAYLLYDRISWRHAFYTGVDTRVIPDIADELQQHIGDMPGTQFFFPYRFRAQGVLKPASNIIWYNEVAADEKNLPQGMFSLNCPRKVYSVTTVTIAALQLAAYLGFSPIYLIGCDTSYRIPKDVEIEDGDPKKLVSTSDDPNHFDPSYFGKGRKWHDPKVDRMFFHYRQACEVCRNHGVEVYNATVGGMLEVFPRVDYREVFGQKGSE